MTAGADTTTSTAMLGSTSGSADEVGSISWEEDYSEWIEKVEAGAAGSAALEKKVADFKAMIDAAIAKDTPEVDLMKLVYDFFDSLEREPEFKGFSADSGSGGGSSANSSKSEVVAPSPVATKSDAAGTKTLVSVVTVVLFVAGYVAL